jgi:hypothetical protein
MSEALSASKYLRFISRPDGWAVYHSLFGNLSLMDTAGKEFIEAFSDSATVDEAARSFSSFGPSMLESYANLLVSRGFLIPAGEDDYSIIEDDQRLREENLHTGYLVLFSYTHLTLPTILLV